MKRLAFTLAVIIIILCGLYFKFFTINSRNLSKQFKDEEISIYIPSGIADDYTDAMKMSFDDGRMWHSLHCSESHILKIKGLLLSVM